MVTPYMKNEDIVAEFRRAWSSQNGQGTNVRMIISGWKRNAMIQEVAPHTYAKLVRGSMRDFIIR